MSSSTGVFCIISVKEQIAKPSLGKMLGKRYCTTSTNRTTHLKTIKISYDNNTYALKNLTHILNTYTISITHLVTVRMSANQEEVWCDQNISQSAGWKIISAKKALIIERNTR
jgi:hypothetical protein